MPFANNQSLKPLLKCPFYADLAFRVARTGKKFSIGDGEKEFQSAVWREVISKESERLNGMPLRRQQTFIEVSVRRAKRMVYSIPSIGLDSEALLKLEEDNLIQRDAANNLVSPAHDVLEDWALERYIDTKFQDSTGNINVFLNAIGCEPAMNRAFRIWLCQKLKYGESIDNLILSILNNKQIEKLWQDETITAVLLSEKPSEFLNELKESLLENNCSLLKRFCFILRVSCKSPDQNLMNQMFTKETRSLGFLKTLYLKPQGKGWESIIHFLFENKENLPKELIPHVSTILADWSSLIHIDKDLPSISREAGLLSLYLLNTIKNSYICKDEQKKLLDIIIKVVPTITQEFNEMLEIDLFNKDQINCRPFYVDKLVDLSLTGMTTIFLCKHAPNTVIKIAQHEWLKVDELIDNQDEYAYYHRDVDECFGLHQYRTESNFFPSSGAKGPFKWLFQYHPRKGIDFIVNLFNTAAERYANSDLDSLERLSSMSIPIDIDQSEVKQIDIILNDGGLVKQYCSERLWLGYRGQSVVPHLLQSALMALENWLIDYTKYSKSIENIEWVFDYVLRNSNSVLTTSVLASVSLGFHDKLGKVVLPLLRTPELYGLDLKRSIFERVDKEPNWFAMGPDPLASIYLEERRAAALQPWRKENLETLITRLQFSDLKEDIFAILDDFRSRGNDDENWRFCLHRIDTRGWQPEVDAENSRIIFTPSNLDPDLEIIQKKGEGKASLNNRIFALFLWSTKTFKKEPLDAIYYESWEEALIEAKNLAKFLDDKNVGTFDSVLYGSIVKAAVIFLRDYSSEMDEDDLLWCIRLIIQTVLMNADATNNIQSADETDHYGDAASASVLPIILDFVSESEDILFLKKTIATALTHANENVRINAANGVRKFMWTKDAEFAQNCMLGTIEYACLMSTLKYQEKYILASCIEQDTNTDFDMQLDSFRDKIANKHIKAEINNISFRSHAPHHLLVPLLIIPKGSSDSTHISLLSQVLELLIENEAREQNHISKHEPEIRMPYNLPMKFAEIFAGYLFNASDSTVEQAFLELLKIGCDKAPNFLDLILLYIQIEGEKRGQKERYWWFWNLLSETIQNIAINLARNKHQTKQLENKRNLIRRMLFADMSHQYADNEYDNIKTGKKEIEKFVQSAGTNIDVFESMSKLMYYYPDLFLNSGLHILSKHQNEVGGTEIFSKNAVFYLEKTISRFLLFDNTKPLTKSLHEACKLLIDAIIETGSSEAYYLREHLIHSRKIIS
ncbi:hypothetical protein [Methanosarcina sp. WWM596]|nr:hypothetical protein [Methanosarcina sp. WWM596]AKB19982.1 hypothetical protein MSWHS_3119 [Methanosarcina sp. WWM596]